MMTYFTLIVWLFLGTIAEGGRGAYEWSASNDAVRSDKVFNFQPTDTTAAAMELSWVVSLKIWRMNNRMSSQESGQKNGKPGTELSRMNDGILTRLRLTQD
jgi:hypothetical protein